METQHKQNILLLLNIILNPITLYVTLFLLFDGYWERLIFALIFSIGIGVFVVLGLLWNHYSSPYIQYLNIFVFRITLP